MSVLKGLVVTVGGENIYLLRRPRGIGHLKKVEPTGVGFPLKN